MNVYLAGSFGRLAELVQYADELEAHGITCTSRWLRGGHEWNGKPDEDMPVDVAQRFALEDLSDIHTCDVVVCFTEPWIPESRIKTDDDIEAWADVSDSSCGYRISSWGRVTGANGDIVMGSPNRGYWYVKPNGKNSARVTIHSLVAEAFIAPRPQGHEIDHIDGDKSNNWVGNLEYVTHTENIRRAARRGLYDHRGAKNPRSKLTADDARQIRRRYDAGERNKAALAREYGVGPKAIYQIVTGRSWLGEVPSKGGKDFEAGYACAMGKTIIAVGHRENVFYCLPGIFFAEDWSHALQLLFNAGIDGWPVMRGTGERE